MELPIHGRNSILTEIIKAVSELLARFKASQEYMNDWSHYISLRGISQATRGYEA